jgi:hypothetical protein
VGGGVVKVATGASVTVTEAVFELGVKLPLTPA